ncbi:MAG: cell division FtsA domain-containing protein, partial [Acidobacteriota bacterium]|nr:cell division FtsA domain-containing protein [Acidobacteriota bacterium]
GTTDLICLVDGSVCHTAVLPAGGDHLTNDIAVGLSTPITEAEVLKTNHGCVELSLIDPEQAIEIPGIGGRGPRLLARGRLCEILQPRAIEILDLVANELDKAGFLDQLNAGLVLTGGGSLVDGFPELTEQRFGLPVRSGQPIGIEGLIDIVSSPIYSTAVGLVLYGHYNRDVVTHFKPNGSSLFGRVSSWLGDLF